MPERITPGELGRYLPKSGLCWITACSGESRVFQQGLAGLSLPDLVFTGIFVPGLNRLSYLLETDARVLTFFMIPEFSGSDKVAFLPLPYREIRAWLSAHPPHAALVMCAPPDADGRCSFGPVTDFIADIWQQVPVLIAHLNAAMPATRGTPGIPMERFTAIIEASHPLLETNPGTDEISDRIARHVASVIPDGATLQAGLGCVPEAVLRGLTKKRGLAIHSGLIGDSTLELLQSGALRAEMPVTAGVAIGSQALYNAVSGPEFRFLPPSYTHDPDTLARIENFVTINSAIEVDLYGQAYAEATPEGYISGPGGASDFAAGARGKGRLRIVVLPSTAGRGKISRIVSPRSATGPVSLGRFDTDLVITEHGIADLRATSHAERRAALLAIADPAHRAALAAAK